MITIEVLDYKLDGLIHLAARTNANLFRRGYAEQVEIVGEPVYIVKDVNVMTDDGMITRKARFARINVQGAVEVSGGAVMLAAVDHGETNIILCAHPEAEARMGQDYFQKLRTDSPSCDHCGFERSRNQTIVVEKDGKVVRVGRSCLEAYLDCPAALSLMRFATAMIDAREVTWEDSEEGSGGHQRIGFAPDDILAVALVVTEFGLHYDKDSVRNGVFEILLNPTKYSSFWSTAPFGKANEIIDWAKTTFDGTNAYMSNVLAILDSEWCRSKHIAFIIGLVPSFYRAMRQKAERAARLNEHFGKVGDKVGVELTHTTSHGYETQYGFSYIHIFRDAEGRTFKWSTSNHLYNESTGGPTEPGDKLRVRGTIKGHETYKDTKQTVLTRCKVEFLSGSPE